MIITSGEVVEGWETLDALENAIVDEKGRPLQDIRIKHTIVLDDPFDDPKGLEVPDRSPEPSKEILEVVGLCASVINVTFMRTCVHTFVQTGRLRDDESLEDDDGITPEEAEQRKRDQEAKAKALTLEVIGDLPYADIKPPENVLFVCKLNPVTEDEDLHLIFSRFGEIVR